MRALIQFVLVAVLFVPAAGLAAENNPVRAMMEHSGMVEQYADIGETFRRGILQNGRDEERVPPDFDQMLADIAGRVANGKELLSRLESALNDALTRQEISAVDAFYSGDLGKRLRQAEAQANDAGAAVDSAAEQSATLAELHKQPERETIYVEMDRALIATELTSSMVSGMMRAMVMSALEAQPNVSDEQRELTMNNVAEMGAKLDQTLRDSVKATLARTYRDISLPDLKEYLVFLKTEAALNTYAVVLAEVDRFLQDVGRRMGKEIAASFRQRKT